MTEKQEDIEPEFSPNDALHVNQVTSAGVAAALVHELAHADALGFSVEDPSRPAVLAVPKGRRLMSAKKFYDMYRKAPERRTGEATFTELESFIEHANRFKEGNRAALFAESMHMHLTSVLNYHEPAGGSPQFGDHRGVYTFPQAEEWIAWASAHGKSMDQASFAAFIENRLPDIADPAKAGETAKALAEKLSVEYATPSKLLTTSRGLSVRVGHRCENAVNLGTGEVSLAFQSTHESKEGGPLNVPAAFLIEIPVFREGAPYQLAVRLRYRLREGSVSWSVELYRHQAAFDHAFKEACVEAQKGTGLPLFFGAPES